MSAINGLAGGAAVSGTTSRFNELSSEEFIKIIFTELQNQDPFKPNDSSALLEQLNSIRSIESDIQLGEQLESIVFQNQLASAGNLIGKRVAGLTADSQRVGGKVESVARTGDEVALILETGWIIPIDNVEYIDSEPAPGAGTGSGSGTGSGGTGGTGGSGGSGSGSGGTGSGGGDGSGSGGGSGGGDGSGGGGG